MSPCCARCVWWPSLDESIAQADERRIIEVKVERLSDSGDGADDDSRGGGSDDDSRWGGPGTGSKDEVDDDANDDSFSRRNRNTEI